MTSKLKLVLIPNLHQGINIPTLLRANGPFCKTCPIVWRVTGTLHTDNRQINPFDNKGIIPHQGLTDINLTRSHVRHQEPKTMTITLLLPPKTTTVRPDVQPPQPDN